MKLVKNKGFCCLINMLFTILIVTETLLKQAAAEKKRASSITGYGIDFLKKIFNIRFYLHSSLL